ncbi:MAG: membrane protein insertion efficiency factor YidD [Ruminococcaceae bacterium]|nr:membrane protein insertion efficiency factor YidD [Oscillospiraceae bacterium]
MNRLFILLIKLYRRFISPMKRRSSCRFYPTCSQYALMCYERFNFFKATGLTIWRLLRCNPFCPGGIDYPPKPQKRGEN